MQLVPLIAIHWREIYPVDSTIQLLNNWGQAQFVHIFAVVARLRHETAEWSRFRLEDVNRRQRFLVPFSNFDTVLKNSTPEKLKKEKNSEKLPAVQTLHLTYGEVSVKTINT